MNHSNHLINETGKYVLFAAIFLVFAFLAFSVMAAAENISATETTMTTIANAIENITSTTIYEAPPDTSLSANFTDFVNESFYEALPASENTGAENITPEGTIENIPTLPGETETAISENRQPLVEASLSSAKVVRGSVFSTEATLRNLGNATANITGIEFNLPPGFSIFSANYESCRYIEPGSECSFQAEFSTSMGTAPGKNKMGMVVKYG